MFTNCARDTCHGDVSQCWAIEIGLIAALVPKGEQQGGLELICQKLFETGNFLFVKVTMTRKRWAICKFGELAGRD